MSIPVTKRKIFRYDGGECNTYNLWLIHISHIVKDNEEYLKNHHDLTIRDLANNIDFMKYINNFTDTNIYDENYEDIKRLFPFIKIDEISYIINQMCPNRYFIISKDSDSKYNRAEYSLCLFGDPDNGGNVELDINLVKECYNLYEIESLAYYKRLILKDRMIELN